MASALVTSPSCFCFGFYPKLSVLTNPFVVSHGSTFPSSTSVHQLKLKHLPRASSEGPPAELIEDSKFVPLSADDLRYGPPILAELKNVGNKTVVYVYLPVSKRITYPPGMPDKGGDANTLHKALLFLGFGVEEAVKVISALNCLFHIVQELLKDLDGEFLEIIFCTEDMITRSLWEAINTKQPNFEAVKIAKSLPRICFFSGLTGEEMMMFIDAFPETGLEPVLFAALVPNSADKPLQELIEEIIGDHEMLSARQSS